METMSNRLQQAAQGRRRAMSELYALTGRKVYYTALCLSGREATATAAVVSAYGEGWSALTAGDIPTEEAFAHYLLVKAAEYCKKSVARANPKAFRMPENRRFQLEPPSQAGEGAVWEALPVWQRFLLVLHTVGDFSPEQLAAVLKLDGKTLDLAMEALRPNVEALAAARGGNDTYDTVRTALREGESATAVPAEVDRQVAAGIDRVAAPLEKKQKQKRLSVWIPVGVAVLLAAVVALSVWFSLSPTDADDTDGDQSASDSSDTADTDSTVVSEPVIELSQSQTYYADIDIADYGTVTVKLDAQAAPVTVANFVNLAQNGFYDGLTFHRIIEDFMMQGGDPNGDGTGGYTDESGNEVSIVGEFTENGYDNTLSHTRGAISMARSSEYNSASSQFFIVHEDSTYLDGQYAVFGYVTEGLDVVDAVCETVEPTDDNGTVPATDQPVIRTITIRTE